MDKRVFRKYMEKEVIQKTIIFADTFGLSIDNWHPSKEGSKFPYRIYLYEKKNIVGYIDATTTNIGDIDIFVKEFPIVLFTPIGNLTGIYTESCENLFCYNINKTNTDTITEIEGLTKISKNYLKNHYDIGSYIKFKDNAEDSYSVSFNHCVKYGTLHIRKNKGLEELALNVFSEYTISHKTDVVRGEYTDINDIKVKREGFYSPVIATFEFNDSLPYEKDVTKETPESNRHKIETIIDLEIINSEIAKHDPRIFEFIEEVRDVLTISTNKGTFSIYDKLAYQSFSNTKNKLKTSLIRDNKISKSLDKNPVLQKMANYSKKDSQ